MAKECQSCGGQISEERLAVLPDTSVCTACAHLRPTPRVKGVTVYPHKTGSFIEVCTPELADKAIQATKRFGQKSILFRGDQQWDGGRM